MQGDTSSAPRPVEAPDDNARLMARLATDFVLRSLQLAAKQHDGDLIMAIVAAAIVSANTAHLNPIAGAPARHTDLDDVAPNEARRPVSVLAIAGSLGLPFETTRRYVNRLIASGQCRRVKGGVLANAEALSTPANNAVIVGNAANVRRLFRDLRRGGVTLD
ncbi:MAG: hypothetical protein JSR86_07920 [Proteobacteria bacterium]|nr:hypothetical protein [Pseudomonadota bacterium]